MAINFKTVRWKNLLSTGNIFSEVILNESPSTLIIGENGAGKSTFIEAISYALYGKPFRKINKPQLVNTINQKNMLVELEFIIGTKEYLIKRGMKPNIFEIYVDSKMLDQDASIKDYQDYLEKHILKLNHKSFSQIVTLGSRSFIPFMQLSAQHRREVIEDLLDLQIFSTMNVLLKQKVVENKTSLRELKYNADLISEKIKLHKEYIKSIQTNHQKQIDANNEKINELNVQITVHENNILEYQAHINDLLEKTKEHNNISKKLNDIRVLKQQFHDKINKAKKDIDFYEENDNCPTCRQGIDTHFKSSIVITKNQYIHDWHNAIDETENLYSELSEKHSKMSDSLDDMRKMLDKVNMCTSTIKTSKDFISKIEVENKRLSQEHKENTTDEKKLDELRITLNSYASDHELLSKRKKILDIIAVLLKDGGIKSKIIKQYIPIMNKLINKYLAAMELTCSFELDENFNETVRSRYRDEFSYDSFSEGEKARIDLAILFAWRSIAKLRNANSTNLLILDETFDGSLDSTGVEELLKIINTISSESNVFVISHKQDQMVDKFTNTIRFEKIKNFSRIKEAL